MRLLCVFFLLVCTIGLLSINENIYEMNNKLDRLIELQEQQLPKLDSVVVDTVRVVKYEKRHLNDKL